MTGAPPGAAAAADSPAGIGGGHPRRVTLAVFENVADPIMKSPGIGRVASDGGGKDKAVLTGVFQVISAVPGVGEFRLERSIPTAADSETCACKVAATAKFPHETAHFMVSRVRPGPFLSRIEPPDAGNPRKLGSPVKKSCACGTSVVFSPPAHRGGPTFIPQRPWPTQ